MTKADRDLQKQILRAMQQAVDRVYRTCKGDPVDTVARKLVAEFKKIGMTLPKADIDQYAAQISGGNEIKFK